MKIYGQNQLNFLYWFDMKSSIELDTKKIDIILVQCPSNQFLLIDIYAPPVYLKGAYLFVLFLTLLYLLD